MKRPVSMPCTKAQFEAMKPKLEMIKGIILKNSMDDWREYRIITNNCAGKEWFVDNITTKDKGRYNRTFYPEFNEQIFLEACGMPSGLLDTSKTFEENIKRPNFDALEERIKRLEKLLKELHQISEMNVERANQNFEAIEKKLAELDRQIKRNIADKEIPETKPDIDYSRIKAGSKVRLNSNEEQVAIVNELSIAGGGKMVFDPYEKHHYLFIKGRGMESIRLTTNRAKKLFYLAKETELLDMGRVRFWF